MEARRESLRALAVALADRTDAVRNQVMQQGGDILAALAKERDYVIEVMADLDEKDAVFFQQLHTEELERRIKFLEESSDESKRYLDDLCLKRNAALERWMPSGKVCRETVRAYVKSELEALEAVHKNGGNRHQKALDQQDDLEALLEGLNDDEKLKIINMQTAEILAADAKMKDDLHEILNPPLETIDRDPQPSSVEIEPSSGKGIMVVLLFVVVVMLVLFKIAS
ncbi:hypothetical protein [Pseudomonas syringae group genomosp. 3]|uniref:Uncharacterized protein n=1 Tax=Pseudomonas syringae pv. maculicola TaxID=59511 RepID=A0A3M6CMH8_PSEYM|nr:hypothetical protein [Pseudomonas syringae group genomosp. 3]RMV44476.1 hypothetical protein ALP13_103323 [Pseudomonas syringae pv. maculicola]